MLGHVIGYHLSYFKHFYAQHTFARVLVTVFSLALGFGIAWGLYILFSQGLLFVQEQEFAAQALTAYLYQALFLVLTFLIWISTSLIILFRIAKSETDAWIITSPRTFILPIYWSFLAFLLSIPIFLILIPGLGASISVYNLSLPYTIIGIFAGILFLMSTVSVSMFILSALLSILYKSNLLSLRNAIISFSLVLVCFIGGITYNLALQDTPQLFQADDVTITEIDSTRITQGFAWTPGYLMASVPPALHQDNPGHALSWTLGLAGIILISYSGYIWLMTAHIKGIWTVFRSNPHTHQIPRSTFPRFSDSRVISLIEKEWLPLVRNKKDILWLSFITLLWLMSMGVLFQAPEVSLTNLADTERFIVYGVWGVAIYFLLAVILKFILTSFMYDIPYQWIIKSSPLSLHQVYQAKYLFYTIIGIIDAILLIGIGSLISGIPLSISLLALLAGIIVIAFSISLALYLGSFFLDISARDVSSRDEAGTTIPGILFILISSGASFLILFSFEQGFTQDTWIWTQISLIILFLLNLLTYFLTYQKIYYRQR